MLWAACTICFFGFFRAGEITAPSDKAFDPKDHLAFGDIAVDCTSNPSIIRIRLKRSKTDPFRRGMDVFVGRTHNVLCPVSAMLAFLAVRGGRAGALFRFQDGRVLTRDRFVGHVREALSKAEVDARNYAGHSFRSGVVFSGIRFFHSGSCGGYVTYWIFISNPSCALRRAHPAAHLPYQRRQMCSPHL